MFKVNILKENDYNKIKYNKKKIKKMLTKQIAQSFIEKKKDKINEIITNSLTNNVLINEENPYKKIGETEEENKDNIIGILRMKKLIGVNLFENKSLNELKINLSPPLIIDKNFGVLNLLTEFTKGRSHMAFIAEKEDVENLQKKFGLDRNNSLKDNSYFNIINSNINVNTKILGIVTLEDVIEKMFNVNILDEDDYNKIKYNKK
jgi:Mg2+/Co2+ transporter CorB